MLNYSHTQNGKAFWVCQCDCGKNTTIVASNLRTGNTKSCGHNALEGIKAHAFNSQKLVTINNVTKTVKQFAQELNLPIHTIHKRRRRGWTGNELTLPTRSVVKQGKFVTYNNVTKNISQWAKEKGLNRKTIYSRINLLGWTPEEALEFVPRINKTNEMP